MVQKILRMASNFTFPYLQLNKLRFSPFGVLFEFPYLYANLSTLDNLHYVLMQTEILALIIALAGFGCTMLFKDFKQFSLVYLVIALFAATHVFLSANTSIKMAWILYHPFYHVYMGLKKAFFGTPVTSPAYYSCAACAIVLLCGIDQAAFRKEMGKEKRKTFT